MKRGVFAFLLAWSFVGSAAVAEDGPPLGSRLGQREQSAVNPRNDARAVRTGHAFARCIVMKRRSAAATFLNAASLEAQQATDRVLSRELGCNNLYTETGMDGRRVVFPSDIYRGMLAEALIAHDAQFEALPTLERQPGYTRVWFAFTGRPKVVDEMATCVAETGPAQVRTLLASTPESPEERMAMQAIGSFLGPCLRAGATLTSNRQSLRAALAEAYYHRLYAPAEPSAAPEGVVVR